MASNTIMSRIANSYISGQDSTIAADTLERPDALTRYFGGHNRKNHPFINGYWQLVLLPPKPIFEENAGSAALRETAMEWWHATCEGFTPPSRMFNKADIPGQGGAASSYITGQTLTRTFSITFREFREMPNFHLFELWSAIIDPHVGVSEFSGDKWISNAYKGAAYVLMTKPTGAYVDKPLQPEDIENVFYFHGVWPENTPHDTLAHDIAANDVIQYTLNFSFDGFPLTRADPDVVSTALSYLNSLKYMDTYDSYHNDLTGDNVDIKQAGDMI